MDRPVIVWMDLTDEGRPCTQLEELGKRYDIRTLTRADAEQFSLSRDPPAAVCIEFDVPSSSNLTTILQVKRENPNLPVLLVTEARSVSLALWALRARVWDYFLKPLDVREFDASIQRILDSSAGTSGQAQAGLPPMLSEADGAGAGQNGPSVREGGLSKRAELAVYRAIRYIEGNFAEEITQSALAGDIAMSPAHFSRVFHRVTGMTFSTYLNTTRVRVAMRLLKDHSLSITSLCYEVGFHDPSHFCRTFRRMVGVSPSAYRAQYTGHGAQGATLAVPELEAQDQVLIRMAGVHC
jgi:AraC-like DNA-binding protein